MSYQYPDVGAFYNGNTTTFVVWAPERRHMDVVVAGELYPMQKDERGYWTVTIDGVDPGTRYMFRIDREKNLPDPASRAQPESVHGPSAVTNRDFAWTDHDWKGLPLADMIIYELHVGTFTEAGTFDGIISKLGYLSELGINTIELMPVAQFPGERNWGYDGVFPFAVQHSYGGITGLKKLVNEAHKLGIAVILDVVYNHQGPEGNYFQEYGPYFTDKYKTFWGSAINFDDAWCDGVRHFYWQNASMWLDDFHIDGLRLDAVHAIWDFSANHFIAELKARAAGIQERTGKHKVLIAEFDLNNPRYINSPSRGGYGLDGQWIDEFHHALHALVTGERDGYYEDFGGTDDLRKSLQHAYVYTGQYSRHRKKLFGALPDNPFSQFVVFAQNHDQVGNRPLGDRLSASLSFEALKLTAAAFLLSPFVPMLFMGEEYGETNPFQYFISHTDEKLVAAVREGRKKEFSYFKVEGEVPDPQSEEAFKKCILSHSYQSDPDRPVLFDYYKHLIHFRKTRPAMGNADRSSLTVYSVANDRVICFDRKSAADHILVLLSFSKEAEQITLPFLNQLRKIFDSAAHQWNGPGEAGSDSKTSIALSPQSAVVFELQ